MPQAIVNDNRPLFAATTNIIEVIDLDVDYFVLMRDATVIKDLVQIFYKGVHWKGCKQLTSLVGNSKSNSCKDFYNIYNEAILNYILIKR